MKPNLHTNLTKNYQISRVIKGGWQLAGGHGKIDRQQAIDDMFTFVEYGINTFDCADIYTGVEELIGEFLRNYKKRYGATKTENIKIHTKFVPDLDVLSHVSENYVESIIDRSLQRLNADRIDLVQFHWWDFDVPGYIETAHALKKLQNKGKIHHLGVTNFDTNHLNQIISSGVYIISNQVQYSILDQRPENGLVSYCKRKNIQLLCYGTLAGGFLREKYLGVLPTREPYENRSLTKYSLIIDDAGGWDLFQQLLKVLNKIAHKHKVSIANIAERYILDKSCVAAIIIGARDTAHLKSNLVTFLFNLDQNDLDKIDTVLNKKTGLKGDVYELERVKGGKHACIMKYNLNKDIESSSRLSFF